MKIINPATEEILQELEEDSAHSLERKFHAAREGQKAWQAVPLARRVEILQQFSRLLEANHEELAAVLTSEVGKPLQQARNEINGARTRIRWMTDHAERYLSEEWMTRDANPEEKIVYEPLGVVCNISAWNYPYLVGVNVLVPALLAGNAVVYKPSEYAALTGLRIGALLQQAGVPEAVCPVATGAAGVGEHLLDLPFDGYFFTGSYKTGQYIYGRVAPKMVPCQCELGGKDPLYVTDDISDVASVAAGTADGAFYNNGQSCCAVERIYVHEQVYDAYLEAFVREVQSWKVGSPLEEGVYIGPLTRAGQLAVLEAQIEDALRKGARLLTGGRRLPGPGHFFEPTVLVDVTHDMQIMREESFGPVIGIMKVRTDEEAVERMNDTAYGLTAAVYAASGERAEQLLQQVNAGTGYWNCCDRVSAAVPWSGRKNSGIGSTLSHAGLRAFTRVKAYHLKRQC
ncbi:MAG TPA: aldehyde dehydrogenase family protein [Chitinophagaceae bacterium]|jgi:acyl-CoA reductase-like NAD-dependent aldehyde dehydrogenase|nr:aldehyde dehydrogenase family protein [Chitinophagaceae bacterium]